MIVTKNGRRLITKWYVNRSVERIFLNIYKCLEDFSVVLIKALTVMRTGSMSVTHIRVNIEPYSERKEDDEYARDKEGRNSRRRNDGV